MNTSPLLRHSVPLALLASLVLTSQVNAATLSTAAKPTATATTASGETVAQHVAAIQAKGDADITVRINSLNSLISKVGEAKRLTTSQKSDLTAEMQAQVSTLTALKATLDSETTVASAKVDFAEIFSQHYIYAFYLPRVSRILAADEQLDATDLLVALEPKLEAYITQAQQQGKNVTPLQSSLSDLKNQTTAAETSTENTINTLLPLSATGYPGNKTTVTAAAASLKSSRANLQAARTDAHSIVTQLRGDLKTVE